MLYSWPLDVKMSNIAHKYSQMGEDEAEPFKMFSICFNSSMKCGMLKKNLNCGIHIARIFHASKSMKLNDSFK